MLCIGAAIHFVATDTPHDADDATEPATVLPERQAEGVGRDATNERRDALRLDASGPRSDAGPGSVRGRIRPVFGSPDPPRLSIGIRAEPSGARGTSRVTESADGAFRFEGLPLGRYELRVDDPSWIMADRIQVVLTPHRPEEEVVLEVAFAGYVTGRLVDAEQAPVPDGLVCAWTASEPSRKLAEAPTSSAGEFVLDSLPPLTPMRLVGYRVEAAPSPAVSLGLHPGEIREGLELTLRRGGTIRGTIICRSTGDGIEGLEVRFRHESERTCGTGGPRAISTDRNGHFHLSSVEPGRGLLLVRSEDHPSVTHSVEVVDEREQSVFIRLDGGLALHGRLESSGDLDIGAARIQAAPYGRGEEHLTKSALVGADGGFTLRGLTSGELLVVATADGYPPLRRIVEVPHKGVVVLRLERGAGIRGMVLPERGDPSPAGYRLYLHHVDEDADFHYTEEFATSEFALYGVVPGTYRIVAQAVDGRVGTGEVELQGGAVRSGFELVLRSGAMVVGEVVAEATQERVPYALVRITGSKPLATGALPAKEVRTDVDGSFEVRGLRADVYDLVVSHREFTSLTRGQPIEVRDGALVDLGVLELPVGGVVAGVVIDVTGAPAAGVNVDAHYWTPSSTRAAARAATDGDGYFRLEALEPGFYRLEVEALGTRSFSARVGGSETSWVELDYSDPGVVLEGLLADEAGAPLADARVYASEVDWRGTTDEVRTRDDGSFRLEGLFVGEWVLRVLPDGQSRMFPFRFSVPAEGAVRRSFRIPGGRIAGRFRSSRPGPWELRLVREDVESTSSWASWARTRYRSATPAESGAFEFSSLPEGRYAIYALQVDRVGEARTEEDLRELADSGGALHHGPLELRADARIEDLRLRH